MMLAREEVGRLTKAVELQAGRVVEPEESVKTSTAERDKATADYASIQTKLEETIAAEDKPTETGIEEEDEAADPLDSLKAEAAAAELEAKIAEAKRRKAEAEAPQDTESESTDELRKRLLHRDRQRSYEAKKSQLRR